MKLKKDLSIEIDLEMVDKIITQELIKTYHYMNEPHSIAVFSMDPEEEAKELKKMKKALKRVISWFGGNEALKELN